MTPRLMGLLLLGVGTVLGLSARQVSRDRADDPEVRDSSGRRNPYGEELVRVMPYALWFGAVVFGVGGAVRFALG